MPHARLPCHATRVPCCCWRPRHCCAASSLGRTWLVHMNHPTSLGFAVAWAPPHSPRGRTVPGHATQRRPAYRAGHAAVACPSAAHEHPLCADCNTRHKRDAHHCAVCHQAGHSKRALHCAMCHQLAHAANVVCTDVCTDATCACDAGTTQLARHTHADTPHARMPRTHTHTPCPRARHLMPYHARATPHAHTPYVVPHARTPIHQCNTTRCATRAHAMPTRKPSHARAPHTRTPCPRARARLPTPPRHMRTHHTRARGATRTNMHKRTCGGPTP